MSRPPGRRVEQPIDAGPADAEPAGDGGRPEGTLAQLDGMAVVGHLPSDVAHEAEVTAAGGWWNAQGERMPDWLRCRPWRSLKAVEFATLEWVDWFNSRRLLEPIGNVPPAEVEADYCAILDDTPMAA